MLKASINLFNAIESHYKLRFEEPLRKCNHLSLCPLAEIKKAEIEGSEIMHGSQTFEKVFADLSAIVLWDNLITGRTRSQSILGISTYITLSRYVKIEKQSSKAESIPLSCWRRDFTAKEAQSLSKGNLGFLWIKDDYDIYYRFGLLLGR